MWGINSAGSTLGFAGAREGDGGEARPLLGVSGRHPPGRGRLLVGLQHHLVCGVAVVGGRACRAGPPGALWGWLRGILYPPCSSFEEEVLVQAQGQGGCTEGALSARVSIPAAMPRGSARGFGDALGAQIGRRAMLANLCLWAGAGTLLSPSEPQAGTVWSPPHPLEQCMG